MKSVSYKLNEKGSLEVANYKTTKAIGRSPNAKGWKNRSPDINLAAFANKGVDRLLCKNIENSIIEVHNYVKNQLGLFEMYRLNSD